MKIDWTVDYIVKSSALSNVAQPLVRIRFDLGDDKIVQANMTKDKFVSFNAELQQIQTLVDSLNRIE